MTDPAADRPPDPRRRWRRPGLVPRLLFAHLFVLSAVLGVALLQIVRTATAAYLDTVIAELAQNVAQYQRDAAQRPPSRSLAEFSRSYLQTAAPGPDRVLIVALTGSPTLASPDVLGIFDTTQVRAWIASPPARTALAQIPRGRGVELLASPIRLDGTVVGVLIAAANLAGLAEQRRRVVVSTVGEAAVAIGAAMLMLFLILRRVLGTVDGLTRTADEISAGDLGRRLNYEGPADEVGRMARTFDRMLGRLSATLDGQRQLLADVSHQLRTPLTVIRGHLELLRRDAPPDVRATVGLVLDELDHTGLLIDRLLLLARSTQPDFLDLEPVDVRSLLGDLLESARVLAPREWRLAPVPDVVARLDETKLRGALLNLIENAVHATGPGDQIELQGRLEDGLVLSVLDTGRGLTPAQQQDVFARFSQPGGPRDRGSGLGLAIVKAVAEAHGGTAVFNSAPGEGTRVDLRLPESCLLPRLATES